MSQKLLLISLFLLGLTAFCSYIGDDDVVYDIQNRKPTPREAIIRIRWVMLKIVTCIYGGFFLASAVTTLLLGCCSLSLSKNPSILIAYACMAPVALLIGILQNGIRRLRGRPTRPLVDWSILQRNLEQWRGGH
jgi:hypothetical protein